MRNRGEMAAWLTSVLDTLEISQTNLIGWSYGGFAALNYAIHRPDRLRKLVLLTPIGSFVPLKAQFYLRGMLTRLPGRFWSNSMMRWFTYAPTLNDPYIRTAFDHWTDQFYRGIRYFRLPPTILPTPYTDEELKGLRSPTLLLIGQQEALYDPVPALARANKLIPNIQAELIPQAGHDLPAGQPKRVDARILEFLNESPSTVSPQDGAMAVHALA
jgi:pimeloyl-ACP methyl ester carboxylesterase